MRTARHEDGEERGRHQEDLSAEINMKDNVLILPAAIIIFLLLFGLIMMGGKMENERLYEKCLSTNSGMVYNDLVKMCKEIVK